VTYETAWYPRADAENRLIPVGPAVVHASQPVMYPLHGLPQTCAPMPEDRRQGYVTYFNDDTGWNDVGWHPTRRSGAVDAGTGISGLQSTTGRGIQPTFGAALPSRSTTFVRSATSVTDVTRSSGVSKSIGISMSSIAGFRLTLSRRNVG
jgi:hypothetical protein